MINILRRILITLSGPVVVIAVFVGVLALFQNRLLYFPTTAQLQDYVPSGMVLWPPDEDKDTQTALSNTGLSSDWSNSDSSNVLGLMALPTEQDAIRGTVIVYHGNAGHAGHRGYYARMLNSLGLRVVLAEYPGYGPRSGRPNEHTLVNDAMGIAKLAHERYGKPLWIIGESLGAGVAAAVAGRVPDLIQGIVLITPWNRLVDVAAYHYSFLPVRWLLKSDYDSIKALTNYNGPKLVITAEQDTIVPAHLGHDLHRNTHEPKRLIEVRGAGHNNWNSSLSLDFWENVVQWLENH